MTSIIHDNVRKIEKNRNFAFVSKKISVYLQIKNKLKFLIYQVKFNMLLIINVNNHNSHDIIIIFLIK